MHSKFTLFLAIGVLVTMFSGCNSFQRTPSQPTSQPTTLPATPIVTDTVPPISATAAPVPSIEGLHMLDADHGWAWTNAQRLLYTSDGGQTWTDRTPAGQVGAEGAFYLDAQTAWLPIYLQDSSRNGLLHTSDGGQTWTLYPYGPSSGLHFTDTTQGWAVQAGFGAGNAYYNLSETQDGGATWEPVPAIPPQPETGLPAGTIHLCNLCNDSFYFDPARMIVVYGDMGSMQPGGSVRVRVSFDLGKTWQAQNLPLPEADAGALVSPGGTVFFDAGSGFLPVHLIKTNSDGSYPYASQRLAFYHTHDGGASWSLLPGVLDNVAPYAPVQIVSSEDIFVLCGNALCASHDGAHTWQSLASNLDFTQTDQRSIAQLDFLNASTGWALEMENEVATLYKTADGGRTWTQIAPRITASAPVTTHIDTSIPTPTLIPTPTPEPTATPNVAFDPNTHAYRIRFPPNATWVELNDSIAANESKRYVLSAMQGQMLSVSIPQGPGFAVEVAGADQKPLSDSRAQQFFWRGALPSTQDYIITVASQAAEPFTLRVVINPPGQATQDFGFSDKKYLVALSYTDDFAPILAEPPAVLKGQPLLTLAFIDPVFYSPTTNLGEAYLTLTATADPAIVAACTQPAANRAETVTGPVTISNYTFDRAEFTGAAAGNLYDQISYRTVFNTKCFEVIFLFHSGNIGNYSPGMVVEFDRAALIKKFETVLDTFLAK